MVYYEYRNGDDAMAKIFKSDFWLNVKRLLAFLFDAIVIVLISNALAVSPLNPNYERMHEMEIDFEEVTEGYLEELEKYDFEKDEDLEAGQKVYEEYKEKSIDYTYEATRISVYSQLISIACTILYFGVFAYFFDGQTVGKRLVHLKIVTTEGKRPSIWTMVIRAIVTYEVPLSILVSILAFVLSKEEFYTANMVIFYLNVVICLIFFFTAFFKEDRRGLHDMIMRTKVVADVPQEKE